MLKCRNCPKPYREGSGLGGNGGACVGRVRSQKSNTAAKGQSGHREEVPGREGVAVMAQESGPELTGTGGRRQALEITGDGCLSPKSRTTGNPENKRGGMSASCRLRPELTSSAANVLQTQKSILIVRLPLDEFPILCMLADFWNTLWFAKIRARSLTRCVTGLDDVNSELLTY